MDRDCFVTNFQTITDHTLDTYEKVCHGDLHSENFFKDENGVYLIDFGWTGPRHSVVDHATLECSLKFKHIPTFVPKDYLTQIEADHLLGIGSFSPGMDLSSIERPEAREVFRLIHDIRIDAIKNSVDQVGPLEYLIAVYVLTSDRYSLPILINVMPSPRPSFWAKLLFKC